MEKHHHSVGMCLTTLTNVSPIFTLVNIGSLFSLFGNILFLSFWQLISTVCLLYGAEQLGEQLFFL